jgi:UDPglucose 6-dehydrogenase
MKIIIAGYGPVGQAIRAALDGRMQVIVDDPWKGKGTTPADMEDVDGVVVCVATPQREDGSCETQNVKDVLRKYGATRFLIKSAVDPVWLSEHHDDFGGSVTVSPEFLRGSHQWGSPTEEFLNSEFAIYGGPDARFWDEMFAPAMKSLKEVKFCSRDQAAFGKYVENCFLATKVTFFNEMYEIYNRLGFEGFDQMVDAITIDPRINRSHTQVPGPDGRMGWGGHCFPKDTAAMEFFGKDTPLLSQVIEVNQRHRNEEG